MNKNLTLKCFFMMFFIVGVVGFVSADTKTLTCDDGTRIQVTHSGSVVSGTNTTDRELDLYINVIFKDGTRSNKVRIHLSAAPTRTTGTGKNQKTEITGTGSGRRDFGKEIDYIEEC
jgi:hypothetical protein